MDNELPVRSKPNPAKILHRDCRVVLRGDYGERHPGLFEKRPGDGVATEILPGVAVDSGMPDERIGERADGREPEHGGEIVQAGKERLLSPQ